MHFFRQRKSSKSSQSYRKSNRFRFPRRKQNHRKTISQQTAGYESLEPRCLLASVFYQSPETVVSIDSIIGNYDGTTYAEDATILNTDATLEDPANPDPADYDGPVRAIKDQFGNTLYPIDSEFGFNVVDFLGAEPKIRDGIFTEGWAGNIVDADGNVIGISVSDAETGTFKSGSPLGTWAAGLGGNSVKASTEHYVVMQDILSDQAFPDDPDAYYQLDNNLVLVGGVDDGRFVADVIAERQAIFDGGDTSVDVFPFADGTNPAGDGVIDIRDILTPNESTVTENIAVGNDYSVTLKDDGKLLYRWGQIVKRPNDIRMGLQIDVPEQWLTAEAQALNGGKGYRVISAELIVNHAITNNPNDQIRPEDYENEAATGRKPEYLVIEHPDHPGDSDYALWVARNASFKGDGTYLPSYFVLDEGGNLVLDSAGDPIVNTDDSGTPIGTIFREVTPVGADTKILTSSDLKDGFTDAWYTSMDRDPFEAVYDADGNYIVGPRWRLKSNKFGQDLPGVEIPLIPNSQPPFQKDNIKYEVGELTTTTINLLDWEAGEDSPLLYSNGWVIANPDIVNDDGVTVNGLKLTDKFDVAFYIKGDRKPTQVYNAQLKLTFETAATFTVTTTADSGAGSLREAIELANANPGVDTIDFAIAGTGVQTITPTSALPVITEALVLDGTTQTGYTVNTPMIELDGSLAGASTDGLRIMSDGSVIQGLVINNFGSDGIELLNADNNLIIDNMFGVDPTGTTDQGNGSFGVHINQSANNVIEHNLISGNDHSGVGVRGVDSTGNSLVQNAIGTDLAGESDLGNSLHGVVVVNGAYGNSIGGMDDAGNLISGNNGIGVMLIGATTNGNFIGGNAIGANIGGTTAIGNGSYGVYLSDSPNNLVSENLVSGNLFSGVGISGSTATDNVLVGNLIGTDESGTAALGNASFGVYVRAGANQNRIGGIVASAANVLSGNGHSGLAFVGSSTANNVVFGNVIGLDASASSDLGNTYHGIFFNDQSHDNRVGAPDPGYGNVISGNDGVGVLMNVTSHDNVVVGNQIGTSGDGSVGIGNSIYGIHIVSSPDNFVSENVIAASGFNGVTVRGTASEGNFFSKNQIGRAAASEDISLANGVHGLLITDGAHDNNVGGSTADSGNTIAFNTGSGVAIGGSGINNQVRYNSIYSNQLWGIDLGLNGVTLNDSMDADVGPNRLQNYPVLASASLSGTTLTLSYSVNSSTANSTYPLTVDFYLADGSGKEGMSYLFSSNYTAADFAAGVKLATQLDSTVNVGDRIVATATDSNGNTSEFSASNITVA